MNRDESTGVISVCPPSLRGVIVRVQQADNYDQLVVRAIETVDFDLIYLEREGVAYKIAGQRGCFSKHGLDAGLVEGLPVWVWVRPAWAHVLIQPYERKPVVWR